MAITLPNRFFYQQIPANSVAVPLGTNGGRGDYLHKLLVTVTAAAGAVLTLNDGGTPVPIMVGTAGQPLGARTIDCEFASKNGGFTITTGAGVAVIAIGVFSST